MSAIEPNWHALESGDVLERLGTSERGLDEAEAARRHAQHGPNAIERARRDGPLRLLLAQLNNPLILVLVGSAAVAVAMGKVSDGLVVAAVVVLNSLIGFVQEYRAGRAIDALGRMVPEWATVVRHGERRQVAVAEIVPGDVVVLASGDKVPADLRLLAVKALQVEEGALTGESTAVAKDVEPVDAAAALGDRTGMAYGGTLVTYGTGTGVVVATGMRTELGRISSLIDAATAVQTPLTRALASIGAWLTWSVLALAAAMVAVGVLRLTSSGASFGFALRETVVFAIALAVGAIPEGLPAILTIALAIGVRRMAARRAIVRRLPAVETLGSTTVICTDKTGTLTKNEMTAVAAWVPGDAFEFEGAGYEPKGRILRAGIAQDRAPEPLARLLSAATLCSDATLETGDPTEIALVVAAAKAGLDGAALRGGEPRVDALPFESEHQYMATRHAGRSLLKGAPERVFARCRGLDHDALHAEVESLARRGLRVLAVAERSEPDLDAPLDHDRLHDGFELLGLIGLIDPPRPEAIAAVAACRSAGIRVTMITGDHRVTAEAIGRQLGLDGGSGAIAGTELARLDDRELAAVAQRSSVFARVAPEHKLRLVRVLQGEGEVVAMTGDGVNDAPALKQADIGVAMGITGTAVSKDAADMVLTDDNFATIVAAVEEGRRVYDNLVKSLAFVLPTNLGLALILVAAVALFPFDLETGALLLPVAPVQLLWINLVASVSLALPLAFEAKEPDVMRRAPRPSRQAVLGAFVLVRTVVVALVMAAGAIGLFLWEYLANAEAGAADAVAVGRAQTMAVTTVILFQVFYLLNSRSLSGSARAIGLFSNRVVYAGIGAVLVLQAAFVYAPWMNALFGSVPLSGRDLAYSLVAALAVIPVIVLEKLVRARPQSSTRRSVRAEE